MHEAGRLPWTPVAVALSDVELAPVDLPRGGAVLTGAELVALDSSIRASLVHTGRARPACLHVAGTRCGRAHACNLHCLRISDFGNCNLAQAVFRRANLEGTLLSKAMLHGTDFDLAELGFAQLDKAVVGEASFSGAIPVQANLALARVGKTGFGNACLISTRLKCASHTDARLEDADLRGAQLDGATRFRTHLARAILENASLLPGGF